MTGVLSLYLLLPLGFAQTTAPPQRPVQSKVNAKLEIQALVDTAQSLPIEYMSDLVLDLIATGKIENPKWRLELLEGIFHRAPTAVNPYAREDIGYWDQTVSQFQSSAYRRQLDSLSIQCRVIKMLTPSLPRKAKELFNQIPSLHLAPLECREPMVYNVEIYYDTVLDLFDHAFTPAERRNGEDLQLLTRIVSTITSVEEARHAARLLSELSLKPDDQTTLVNSYAGRLSAVTGGDRDFSYTEKGQAFSKSIQKIAATALSRNIQVEGLLRAYRGLLIRYLTGPRCGQSLPPEEGSKDITAAQEASNTVRFFNDHLASLSSDPSLRIMGDAVVPERILEGAKFEALKFPTFNGLLHQLDMMRNHLSSDSGDWAQPLSDFLSRFESTEKVATSCDKCRFHERAGVYIVLVDLVPEGALREAVVTSYLDLLALDKLQSDNPVEWLDNLKWFLRLTRPLTPAQREKVRTLRDSGRYPNMLPGDHAKDLLLKLRASTNPLLATYAYKEMIAPGTVDFPW